MPTRRKRQLALKEERSSQKLQPGEVVGYVRVSTDEQAESGLGIGAQIAKIKAQASVKDWPDPVIFIDDGVSGTIPIHKRLQFQMILQAIEDGRVKSLITSSLDRIGRRANIIINFIEDAGKKNITFVSCREGFDTTTAYGQFGIIIMSAIAQLERDLIISRTRDAMAEKSKRDGDAGGRLPYGYKRVFALVATKQGQKEKTVDVEVDQDAAQIVRRIFNLRDQRSRNGRPMSLRKIAAEISKICPISPQGGKWYASAISDILSNEEAYRGGLRGVSTLVRWPTILTK